ncbi:MAG TPA: hypothetical protein VL053_07720 [Arachidicoccus sp.]|nr:hypothetical protein [Arachidicoccus sp.]
MLNAQSYEPEMDDLIESSHLRYIDDFQSGFHRIKKREKSFTYVDEDGNSIKDAKVLDRIKGLVLPPAWSDVWICRYANGHLQATGYDTIGRKQYRYHDTWSQVKNASKFDGLAAFGCMLPKLRRQLRKDIKNPVLNKIRVTALAVAVMDETFIRAGNTSYEEKYGSYGLTTLKNRHISMKGGACFFRFKGKKGIMQQLSLNSKALAGLLKKVMDIPGQTLFQYYDEDGEIRRLESGDVNDYLKLRMDGGFTCKDFRTWAGTLLALNFMKKSETEMELQTNAISETERHKRAIAVLDQVATELGNTRTVTKKYYVHPGLLELYELGLLSRKVKELSHCRPTALNKTGEKELLKLLKWLSSQAVDSKGRYNFVKLTG